MGIIGCGVARGWGLGVGGRGGHLRQEHPQRGTGRRLGPGSHALFGRGAARAEDAQGTPTQSHTSPSIPVYEYWCLDWGIPVWSLGVGVAWV